MESAPRSPVRPSPFSVRPISATPRTMRRRAMASSLSLRPNRRSTISSTGLRGSGRRLSVMPEVVSMPAAALA